MYLEYFDKFKGMTPYLEIKEDEWSYIKDTFEKNDVKESLAKVAMTYEIPYALISENDAYKDLMKLKLSLTKSTPIELSQQIDVMLNKIVNEE